MSDAPLRLAVLTGSAPESRTGPAVARWVKHEAVSHGQFDVDIIDVAEDPLPVLITQSPSPETVRKLERISPRLAAADAFVVLCAEYNHSFPAVLKSAVDWHTTEWYAKPVSFVSYGGRSGGLRAVEQFRLVFSELHAVTLRDGVSFPNVWEEFDENGEPRDSVGSHAAAKTMFDQLLWWAESLREARKKRPYTH